MCEKYHENGYSPNDEFKQMSHEAVLSWLVSRDRLSGSDDFNMYIDYQELGVLLIEYQFIRRLRNQMNHSGLSNTSDTTTDDDVRISGYFSAWGMNTSVVDMKVSDIQRYLSKAAKRLGKLEQQASRGQLYEGK